MMSTESWPQPAIRLWMVAQRFQKFLVVGAFGLGVNLGSLYILHSLASISGRIASPIAIFISMIVTFSLNERWTWHDRGSGKIVHRVLLYFPINCVGLLINYLIFLALHYRADWNALVAQLVGAGFAAIWNFSLNNMITWRDQKYD
jgi:putative flippase GtrA